MTVVPILVSIVLLIALLVVASRLTRARREAFIRSYDFPPGLIDGLGKAHPQLALKDRQLVAHALRQFFLAWLMGGRKPVSMPSQVADDLWHGFILDTRHYEAFCRRAFGAFLHHTPAVVLGSGKASNAGLRRVFWHACLEENINPRKPTRLPLLFALDRKLAIAGGFAYLLDCRPARAAAAGSDAGVAVHCATDIGDASVDGTTDGFGDGGGSSGGAGASGDGGGDGGGGCGGSE